MWNPQISEAVHHLATEWKHTKNKGHWMYLVGLAISQSPYYSALMAEFLKSDAHFKSDTCEPPLLGRVEETELFLR